MFKYWAERRTVVYRFEKKLDGFDYVVIWSIILTL